MNVGLVLTGSIRLVRGQLRRPNERDLLCNERVSLHNAAAAHTSSAQASLPPSLPPAPAKAALATGVKTLKKRAKNSAQKVSE